MVSSGSCKVILSLGSDGGFTHRFILEYYYIIPRKEPCSLATNSFCKEISLENLIRCITDIEKKKKSYVGEWEF